jgi:queuosine precursor transporter
MLKLFKLIRKPDDKSSDQVKIYLLIYICMLYMAVMLSSAVLTNKLITIGPFTSLAGAIVVPISFSLADVLTELYGYKIAIRVVLSAFICQICFSFIVDLLSHLHSPATWHGQQAYDFVLGSLYRISFASFVAYFLSSFINVYVLSKWRRLWQGKLFFIRSMGSSCLGELIFTVLAVIFIKYGRLPWSTMFSIIFTSYSIKIIGSFLFTMPSSLFVLLFQYRLKIEKSGEDPGIISPFKV